jgi:hypothetical protein
VSSEETWSRPLGGSERYLWLIDRGCPFNFLVHAEVTGPLSEDTLRAALDAAQSRHALLRARIVERKRLRPEFHTDGVPPIPLACRDVDSSDVAAAIEQELNTRIPTDPGPMARVLCLRHGDASTLVVNFNHVIGDARSGVFVLRDVLQACEALARGEAPGLAPLEPPPAQEAFFPNWALGFAGYSPRYFVALARLVLCGAPDFPKAESPGPVSERRGNVIPVRLKGQALVDLVARARAEGTTVHGALATAVNLSLRGVLGAKTSTLALIAQPIDLRNRLKTPIGEACGFFQGVSGTHHRVAPTANFWDLAREAKRALTADMEAGRHLTLFTGVMHQIAAQSPLYVWGKAGFDRYAKAIYGISMKNVVLSNIGRCGIPADYGELSLGPIGFCASPSVGGDLYCFAATNADVLTLNVVAVRPHYSRDLAEQLAAGVRRHLDTALDTPVAEPLPVAPVSPWPACLRLLVALLLVAAVIAAWALRSS